MNRNIGRILAGRVDVLEARRIVGKRTAALEIQVRIAVEKCMRVDARVPGVQSTGIAAGVHHVIQMRLHQALIDISLSQVVCRPMR